MLKNTASSTHKNPGIFFSMGKWEGLLTRSKWNSGVSFCFSNTASMLMPSNSSEYNQLETEILMF